MFVCLLSSTASNSFLPVKHKRGSNSERYVHFHSKYHLYLKYITNVFINLFNTNFCCNKVMCLFIPSVEQVAAAKDCPLVTEPAQTPSTDLQPGVALTNLYVDTLLPLHRPVSPHCSASAFSPVFPSSCLCHVSYCQYCRGKSESKGRKKLLVPIHLYGAQIGYTTSNLNSYFYLIIYSNNVR